ncbi:cytochrome P-450, putative [Pediculus humanus corporis]|uniref:Cytochrome P-450, putative n=1 Tax=Pediculus humanus subsp. corporis TaxID=121224 RepID=E0VAD1_PEDHC|nr:cytochrome P-450, putative [Pediculus humanus corporis]EEB10337.1 cytochrome P-450, putative [Pediculus humanus corporis]
MWFLFNVALFLMTILLILIKDVKKPKKFPPGPKWKPFVGCHFEIKNLIKKLGYHHLAWEELYNKYGPLVGLRLGKDRIILVSGQSNVKKVLLNEDFDARPDGFFFRMRSYKQRLGIVFVEGIHFQEQKKFCMMTLKKFGLGKKIMEDIIMKEANELVLSIREKSKGNNNIFQMKNIFDIAVLNSLWALMAGTFDLNDENLSYLMDLVHEAFRLLDMSGGILNQMPFLRFVAPDATGYNRVLYVINKLEEFLKKTIHEHKKNLNNESTDLIDMFLNEMKNGQTNCGKNSSFSDKQLIILLLDLFMAGSETTSNNLSMAMLYMIMYPNIQDKVHENIDSVVTGNRLPNLQDRPLLKYVEAVLFEVQRHGSVVPISVPHRSTKDVYFDDYIIPKDTMILVNLRSVHMDKNRWGDPENFRPERFIDSDGQIVQNEWFIPFGQGRRRCLGKGLARSSMFLLFSAIMKNYQIIKVDNHLSLTPQDGVTLSPGPFRAIIKPRFSTPKNPS